MNIWHLIAAALRWNAIGLFAEGIVRDLHLPAPNRHAVQYGRVLVEDHVVGDLNFQHLDL